MKPNELRIGNWVNIDYTHGRKSTKILSIDTNGASVEEDEFSDYFDYNLLIPIPLTEQWLKDFRLHPLNFYIKQMGVHKGNGCYWAVFTDNEFGYEDEDRIKIEHVHQLQNLYFCLTGNELVRTL